LRNFKIFQIISAFSKEERKEFEYFIQSPYLTSSRDYHSLLKAIYSFYNNSVRIKEITNEEFYGMIFSGKKYNNKTFRNRLNELTVLAKRFLIQKALENEKPIKDLLLLRSLKERKLFRLFRNEFERVNEEIEKSFSKAYYNSEIKVLSAFVYLENQDFNKLFESYKESTDYMLLFFLENYFVFMIEFENEKHYGLNTDRNIAYDILNNLKADKFIKTLEARNDKNYLVLFLNYYLYRSFHDLTDEISFKKFSDILFRNLDNLSYEQKNTYFGYMISRYFMISNSGKPEVLKDVFKLYNIKLKIGLYSELNEIRYPSTAYRDYIVVGLKLKKYRWVKDFIEKYSGELPKEIRNDEINMAYARLYLFKKEYDNALKYLNELKTSNYLYLLDASRIKLRIHFDKSNFDDAFLEIDRVKYYIKNNSRKIALSVRKYSLLFIDIYSDLLRLKLNSDKTGIDFLTDKILKNPSLVSKEWFNEKIREMA